jgi:type IV secretion system protein VirB10
MYVLFVVLAFAVFAVILVNFLSPHKKVPPATQQTSSRGMPYRPLAEPAAIVAPKPIPQPVVVPKSIPASTPAHDNALAVPIASGSGYDGGGGNTIARGAGLGPTQRDDEFTAAMTASGVGAPAKAHRMKHPSLTIPAGQVVGCTLQTAINSQLMGFADCDLAQPVMSADGTVELMPKGTQLMGQIKSGLRRGQTRLFLLWVRARTPDNIVVDLASPAADELGRAGIGCISDDDCVNTHFWKMFWTAALFSLVEYGPQLATQAIQNHGNSTISNYTTFLTPQQSLAQTILQDDLRIPPTIELNQGHSVSVFIARDLDFSSVYALKVDP